MGIIALSNSKVKYKVRSAMVIGAYSDFSKLVPYILKNFTIDSYACFSFLFNYIRTVLDVSNTFLQLLFESAIDSAIKRESFAPALLNTVNVQEQNLYNKIISDSTYRNKIGSEILKKLPSLSIQLSPIHYLENLESKISILHGKGDKVISEFESIEMSKKLSLLKKRHKLEISGLLSHGDYIPWYKRIGDISGMLNIFGYYLDESH